MATTYTNSTFKVFSDKMGGRVRTEYVGDAGEIFYDPIVPELFLSDGVTPGGIPILGTSTISLSAFYTKTQVDTLCQNLIGTANSSGDTLGELQTLINNNTTSITNLQNTLNTLIDFDQQTLSFDANTNVLSISNGNSVDLSPLVTYAAPGYGSYKHTFFNNASPVQPQTAPAGHKIPFSLNIFQGGGVSRVNNDIKLLGGSTYYITFTFTNIWLASATGSADIQLVNPSNFSQVYATGKIYLDGIIVNGTGVASSASLNTIMEVTADTMVCVIITNLNTTIPSYECFINIHTI